MRRGGQGESLYRDFNRALREDSEVLAAWGSYLGCIFYGGAAQFTSCLAPPSALPAAPQTTHRGFSMPAELAGRYPKGKRFFWQTCVSTSKSRETSETFAADSLSGCPDGHAAFLFVIELPAYNEQDFWAYELEGVTACPGESEVLLLPYTMFEVKEAPRAGARCTEIVLRVVAQPLIKELERITVWVDPSGFEAGSNRELAHHAFATGMPKFRTRDMPEVTQESWGALANYDTVPGHLDALALFTDAEAALRWMGEQLRKSSGVLFKLVASGRVSEQFFNGFNRAHGATPYEALVFCGDEAKWRAAWSEAPRVRVTSEPAVLREYLTHTMYDQTADKQVPLSEYQATFIAERARVHYPWRRVEGGVVYGGAGTYQCYAPSGVPEEEKKHLEPGWQQATGTLPEVPMAPFD